MLETEIGIGKFGAHKYYLQQFGISDENVEEKFENYLKFCKSTGNI